MMQLVEQLVTFIYALVDPRNQRVMYVGKFELTVPAPMDPVTPTQEAS